MGIADPEYLGGMAQMAEGTAGESVLIAVPFPIGEAHLGSSTSLAVPIPAHVAIDENGVGHATVCGN